MITGTVTSEGTLSFSITLDTLLEALEVFGCEIVGGEPVFTGSAGAAGISAQRTMRLQCDAEGGPFETDFEYSIVGPKT